jgi:hypothetical protein
MADSAGVVYVVGMGSKRIYRLLDGTFEVWFDVPGVLKNPNGIYVSAGKLLIGEPSQLLTIDLEDKSTKAFSKNTGGIDGIAANGKGGYYISDWSGTVRLVHPDGETEKILNTSGIRVNAADIEYVVDKSLLLVPTFLDNRVMAYKVR